MATHSSPDEDVLYQYSSWNTGAVRVTNSQLRLGRQTWQIEDLLEVHLTTRLMLSRVILDLEKKPSFWAAFLSGLALMLLILLVGLSKAELSLLVYLAGIVLIVLFVGGLVYTVVSNPQKIYKAEIMLKSGQQMEAAYVWYDQRPAEAAVAAVQKALALGASQQREPKSAIGENH